MQVDIILCMRLEVRKNTLPYIHPFSIMDVDTNETFGGYKTRNEAEKALKSKKFQSISEQTDRNAIECMEKRINNPDGDGMPIKNQQKNIRRIRLK